MDRPTTPFELSPPGPALPDPGVAPDKPFTPDRGADTATRPTVDPHAEFVRTQPPAAARLEKHPQQSELLPLGAIAAGGTVDAPLPANKEAVPVPSADSGDSDKAPSELPPHRRPNFPSPKESPEDFGDWRDQMGRPLDRGDATAGGGDVPGPPETPGTPETPSPDDEGRFLPPIPRETASGVQQLRYGLVDALAETPLSEAEIIERLRADASLGAAYPERRVPEAFRQAHPNIRFVPPRINEASLIAEGGQDAAEEIIRYANTSGLTLADIATPEALAEQLVKIRSDLSGQVPQACLNSLQDDVIIGYTNNLELHRLTQDPNGRLVRFTHDPIVDSPDSTIAPGQLQAAEDHSSISFRFIHPSLRPMASVSWLTSWYRQELSPAELESQGIEPLRRTRIETKVGILERNSQLALDRSNPMSLLAFRSTYR